MTTPEEVRSMVERIVNEVLESRIDEIRAELVQRVEGELQPLLVQREGATALLNVAVNAIQDSMTQADILKSVLEGSTNFAGRCILFVIRGDAAVAWSSRGFAEEKTRMLSLSATSGPVAEVVRAQSSRQGAAAELLGDIIHELGAPVAAAGGAREHALLAPMKLRDKVPAVLYADTGPGAPGRLDAHALQLLLRSAALWLEVIATRRGVQGAAPAAAVSAPEAQPAPAPDTWKRPSGIAPERVATSPIPQAPRAAVPVMPPERVSESGAALAGLGNVAAQKQASGPAPNADVAARARRFAKLLVDEIVLYNGQKVLEGRQHHDLYDRLRDDIERSRSAYQQRFGSTPGNLPELFDQELVAVLANNDPTLLGSSFHR
ncbi:MAG: hypothetical protein JO041_04140 [Acidobacteria bacterium]|nr:hypothetical protein [Acidobacteriota bacterium]